jgi:hypothetical protein
VPAAGVQNQAAPAVVASVTAGPGIHARPRPTRRR